MIIEPNMLVDKHGFLWKTARLKLKITAVINGNRQELVSIETNLLLKSTQIFLITINNIRQQPELVKYQSKVSRRPASKSTKGLITQPGYFINK